MNDELKTQLTAWALDELPTGDRTSIDECLEAQPEAKAYAEETREFCTLLSRTLAPVAEVTLTPDQREELARQFRSASPAGKVVRFRPAALVWVAGLGAVAAALVIWSGRFAVPDDGVVAMDHWNESLEVARSQPTGPKDSGVLRQLELKTLDDGTMAGDDGSPRRLAEAERGGIAQALATDLNVPTDPASRPLDRADGFGVQPEPQPTDTPSDALADAAELGFGSNPVPELAKMTTWAAQSRPTESFAEGLVERRSGEGDALSTTAGALAATPTAPAASAAPTSERGFYDTTSDRQLELKAEPAKTDASGASLIADRIEGEEVEAKLSRRRMQRGPAAPDVTADFDVQTGPTVAANKPQDPRFGGGLADGATPAGSTSFLSSARPAGGAGLGGVGGGGGAGGLVADETTTPNYAKETADYGRKPPEPSPSYRYLAPTPAQPGNESYAAVPENPFKAVALEQLSTFSIDVDTAGYANVRRFLNQGQRPPQPAVRIEEMVNYFRYDYPQPEAGKPFSVTVDIADCPWQPQHRLARVGLKGRDLAADKRPNSNLVFLIDVSGSMDEPNKLPLVQQSLRMLSSQLTENDRVAMVTYAGNSGLALDSTNGTERARITSAIDQLVAGGSTNGASGIQVAYQVAQQHFIKEGVNRVLLATDGDFNVGVTSQEELQKLITERAKGGVFLSVLGYGMGNLKDSTMEMLADKGNGNYAYIDSLGEARKVLSEEMSGTLVTIAKDVKIQVEFNPAIVRSYRLLGYENRMLAKEDFNDDKKDAGEIGAGHTVTALYELVPVGAPPDVPPVDALRYTPAPIVAAAADARKALDPAIARQTMTVKLRYKAPDADASQAIEVPVVDKETRFVEAPADFKFAASVTMFGMLLKDSAHKGNATWDQVRQFALEGKGPDPLGYRGEFVQLVEKARGLVP